MTATLNPHSTETDPARVADEFVAKLQAAFEAINEVTETTARLHETLDDERLAEMHDHLLTDHGVKLEHASLMLGLAATAHSHLRALLGFNHQEDALDAAHDGRWPWSDWQPPAWSRAART